ncbi:hypothetical protein ERUR111494_01545 [Erysipelothrix urinaevulpis]|uniref:hypothetical protein n=1 Tax=Erysipelothrix urinaevulpis TaxID=2683717 RepID=UPI00135CB40C|nr:hypothetical protein [Erysipelothrix urinaevulpis]
MSKTRKSIIYFSVGAILIFMSLWLLEYRLHPQQVVDLEFERNNLKSGTLLHEFKTKKVQYRLYETDDYYVWMGISKTGFLWRNDQSKVNPIHNETFGEMAGSFIIKEKENNILLYFNDYQDTSVYHEDDPNNARTFLAINNAKENIMVSYDGESFKNNPMNKKDGKVSILKESPTKQKYNVFKDVEDYYFSNTFEFYTVDGKTYKINDDVRLFNEYTIDQESKSKICFRETCKIHDESSGYEMIDSTLASMWFEEDKVYDFIDSLEEIGSLELKNLDNSNVIFKMMKNNNKYYFVNETKKELSLKEDDVGYNDLVYRVYDGKVKMILKFFDEQSQ